MNEQTQLTQTAKKERNLYISYIKGAAIIGIILIHLIDWSNMRLPKTGHFVEDLLHSAVLLFVLVGGSVTFVAYERKPISIQVKRLIYRAGQLLFIYYLYSIVKLLIFNFRTEPFYEQFSKIGTLTIPDILKFHSFSVPITVLITYPFLLAISPLFLSLEDKTTGSTWSRTFVYNSSLASAEWIEEAPYSGIILPLANYGTTNFDLGTVNGGENPALLNQEGVIMYNPNGQTSNPSAPDSNTDGFNACWGNYSILTACSSPNS